MPFYHLLPLTKNLVLKILNKKLKIGTGKFKDASILYYFQGEEDWQITKECFIKSLGYDPNDDKEIIECASIFEFFKVIRYNNKTKKWE